MFPVEAGSGETWSGQEPTAGSPRIASDGCVALGNVRPVGIYFSFQ